MHLQGVFFPKEMEPFQGHSVVSVGRSCKRSWDTAERSLAFSAVLLEGIWASPSLVVADHHFLLLVMSTI